MPEAEKRTGQPSSSEAPVQEEKKFRKEMEPTVKDPQLQTILAAITAGQTESSKTSDAIDGKMGQLCSRQDKQEKDIEYLKSELSLIKAGQGSGSSSGISRSSSSTIRHSLFEDYRKVKADEKTDLDDQYSLPMVKRRVLAIGGHPEAMVKVELEAAFKEIFISELGEAQRGTCATTESHERRPGSSAQPGG